MVTLTIDNRTVTVPEGTTILEAARSVRLDIPTLCYLKDINEIGACRICMVEVEGEQRLVAACDTQVAEGIVVHTNSPRVREARRVNLRLLLAQHDIRCPKCTRSGNCKLQQLTNDYNLLGNHYIKDLRPIEPDFSIPVVRFENRCIRCMRCIQVCDKIQGMHIWDLMGTGTRTTIGVSGARTLADSDCTFCGQCMTHCPVGGLQEHDDTGRVFDALANPKKITVVQMAPAVRAAWAEYYHLKPEYATAQRMVTALKQMGFDYVFDTNFTADLTIMEEGSEFVALHPPGSVHLAHVHLLLSRLGAVRQDPVPQVCQPSVHRQESPADVRCRGQELLRQEAGGGPPRHLRGVHHALHRQKERGGPAHHAGRLR